MLVNSTWVLEDLHIIQHGFFSWSIFSMMADIMAHILFFENAKTDFYDCENVKNAIQVY